MGAGRWYACARVVCCVRVSAGQIPLPCSGIPVDSSNQLVTSKSWDQQLSRATLAGVVEQTAAAVILLLNSVDPIRQPLFHFAVGFQQRPSCAVFLSWVGHVTGCV